jgi:hypothetical protein
MLIVTQIVKTIPIQIAIIVNRNCFCVMSKYRKINQRNPQCQIIDELRTAILQEWQQFPQERLRRLTLACQPTHDCRNGGLLVGRAHCHGILACPITIKNVQV